MKNNNLDSSISMVVPVYNEKDNIKIFAEILKEKFKYPIKKVFIVYDFDEDNTLQPLEEIRKIYPEFEPLKNKYGRGAFNAIKTGLDAVDTEYVIVTNADMSDDPETMNKMLEIAEREGCVIVCGARYMKGGALIGGPFIKGLMSRMACLTMYYIAGVPTHDATNSFKLYRKSFLNTMNIESSGGFELGLEMTVKAYELGLKIKEVPTVWHDRTAGTSRFRVIAWMPSYLKWYIRAFCVRLKHLLGMKSWKGRTNCEA